MQNRNSRDGSESTIPSSKLVRVSSAAHELACATRTVWRLIDAGELVSVRIGRRGVRIDRESLDAFIARRGVRS